jgi:hypothetical protein
MNSIERLLQLCLNNIQKWADENGFQFSKTKTVSMHFCQLRTLHTEPELKLDGVSIPVVEEYKFPRINFRQTFFSTVNTRTVRTVSPFSPDSSTCQQLYLMNLNRIHQVYLKYKI